MSDSDDPMDFFNINKKKKKLYPVGRQAKERAQEMKKAVEERDRLATQNQQEAWWKKNTNGESAETRYYEKYQKQERERMQAQTFKANSSIFVTGSVSSKTRPGEMSEIESMTLDGASISGVSKVSKATVTRPDNLRQKFDFRIPESSSGNISQLPVFPYRNQLIEKTEAYPVTVISGSTGCGKTTQIPQFILDHYAANDRYVNIIVTQPRRIAAQAVAKRVCKERKWCIGQLVGYKVGLDKANASKDTRLLYVTTGVLIKMLITQKNMSQFTHVIIDEVHERDKDMDFLLILTRKFITSNSQGVKIILMSATLNADKLLEYYSWPIYENGPLEQQGCKFNIPVTMNHDVALFYLDEMVGSRATQGFKGPTEKPQLNDSCIEEARKIVCHGIDKLEKDKTGRERGAVLMFLPGELEIATVIKAFRKKDPDNNCRLVFLPLHSRLPFESAQKIFEPVEDYHRKVILATNMAESSITIPDISYVIDFCLTKKLICDNATNYAALQLVWADKASCEQRKGRAGRVKSGRVYRMVYQDFYERIIQNEHEPEMRRAPLDKLILDSKLLDMGPPVAILSLAMDPPDFGNIKTTVMHLKDVGALLPTATVKEPNQIGDEEIVKKFVEDDGDITVLGELIAALPIDIRLGKLVILGYLFDVLEECIIIAAGLCNKSIFAFPFEKKLKAYANKLVWSNQSFSDCLAVLNAYSVWKDKVQTGYFERRYNEEQEWCNQRYLQMKSLKEMEKTITELKRSLSHFNIGEIPTPNRQDRLTRRASDNDYLMLKVAIFGAFYPNYFIRSHGSFDMKAVLRELSDKNPMTTMYLSGFPVDQTQFGDLYVNQIKELFKETQPDPNMIDVEFQNSKILVEFYQNAQKNRPKSQSGSTLGDETMIQRDKKNLTPHVIHHIYVGMKLKSQGREQLSLTVYKKEEAQRLWEKHDEVTKRVEQSDKSKEFTMAHCIGQIDPPELDSLHVRFLITHVDNPNSFWVNYCGERFDVQAHGLQDAIGVWMSYVEEENLPKIEHFNQVTKYNIYLAPFRQEYYRGRVDALDRVKGTANVFFIDYGNVEEISIYELVQITKKGIVALGETAMHLVKVPALALECSLLNTKPNAIMSDHEEWSPKAVRAFEQLLPNLEDGGCRVTAEVYSVTPGPFAPKITGTFTVDRPYNPMQRHCITVSLNDQFRNLKDEKGTKFAEYCDEKYLDQQNNKERQESRIFYNPDRKLKIEERQKQYYGFVPHKKTSSVASEAGAIALQAATSVKEGDGIQPEIDPVTGKEVQRFVECQLKGPFHPLEFHLSSAHKVGGQKTVRVEPESVNSVLIDDHPEEAVDQYLVAGHVGLNPSATALMARSTTMMPNKLGIGATLTMVFAPKVEMRIDKKQERYIGCLAGLGHFGEEESRQAGNNVFSYSDPGFLAYNKEHDMEIRFDATIDNDDIGLINMIRYHINTALSRIPDAPRKKDSKGTLMISVQARAIEYQDSLRDCFDKLLFKDRHIKSKEVDEGEFRWGYLNKLRYPNITLNHFNANSDEDSSLKTITGVIFPPKDEIGRAEEIVEGLKNLKRLANTTVDGVFVAECPVCADYQRFEDPASAKKHLKTPVHMKNVRDLRERLEGPRDDRFDFNLSRDSGGSREGSFNVSGTSFGSGNVSRG